MDRILIAADESPGPLAAVRALRAAGYEPWVAAHGYEPWLAAHEQGVYAARSRAAAGTVRVPSPLGEPDAFAAALAEAARSIGAAAVLPGTEASLLALAAREAMFPAGVAVGVCGAEAAERATSKQGLPELAAAAGLATPPTLELRAGDLDGAAGRLEFPLVVKPLRTTLRGEGGVGHYKPGLVEGPEELRRALDGIPGGHWLVQPWLGRRLEAVFGVAWHGELVCVGHQAAARIWPPDCGGSSYAETVTGDFGLEEGVRRLAALLGWSGIVQAQFLRSGGRTYLIDLNPRVYGSLALAVAAGLNLPAIWADLLLGRRPAIGACRPSVRYRSEEKDLRALCNAFRAGRRAEALAGLLPRPRTTHAVFSRRDPAPVLATLAKAARLLRGAAQARPAASASGGEPLSPRSRASAARAARG